ncbi:hypothetical protein D9V84_10505 [Bacteroidetes/Chlorobi group bacterium Naka2016]|jgi:hypothetical protein|nr:MAG: hypothetical protein D9V84_10505 [Bacteroidetes/Chlorobi group bacterium Naka2016]
MPTKEIIAGSKITENMLVPHMRKRFGGKSIYNTISNQEQKLYGICGENITQGDAICFGNDGKIYKADALANKPAFGFAAESGITNDEILLQTDGLLEIELGGTTDIGSFVFLRSNGNIGTIERINSGDIIQIVGIKNKENQIIIRIYNHKTLE